jgi:hypothetical protein
MPLIAPLAPLRHWSAWSSISRPAPLTCPLSTQASNHTLESPGRRFSHHPLDLPHLVNTKALSPPRANPGYFPTFTLRLLRLDRVRALDYDRGDRRLNRLARHPGSGGHPIL